MRPTQTYKILHSKGNYKKKNEKATYGMGENSCKWCSQQGLIPQIYKQLIQLNNKKTKQPKWQNEQKT